MEMSRMSEFSTFRATRPAGRLGGAARLSAARSTLVASDPMLGGPRRAQDRQFATSGPPIRGLGTGGSGPVLGE